MCAALRAVSLLLLGFAVTFDPLYAQETTCGKICENGGSCYKIEGREFCTCPPGFNSDTCTVQGGASVFSATTSDGASYDVNPEDPLLCKETVCEHGGSCYKDEIGLKEHCACPPGFTGVTCNSITEIDAESAQSFSDESDEINHAYGRPVMSAKYRHQYPPEFANDGNTNGNMFKYSCYHSSWRITDQPWWAVDLMGPVKISRIEIFNRVDCCACRLHDFTVGVSNVSPRVVVPSITQSNYPVCHKLMGVASSKEVINCTEEANTGRYVIIQKPTDEELQLCEVRVFGIRLEDAAENLAFGKPIFGSPPLAGFVRKFAVDGNTDGNMWHKGCSHSVGINQAWWAVDLGTNAHIVLVQIFNRVDCCANRLQNFDVSVSNVSPAVIKPEIDNHPLCHRYQGLAMRQTRIQCAAQNNTGRYVIIQLRKSNVLQLCEVRVFGTPIVNNTTTEEITTVSGISESFPGDVDESSDKLAEDGVNVEGSLPGDVDESTDKPAEDGVPVEASLPGDVESTDNPAEDGVTVKGSVPGDEESIDKAAEDTVTDEGSLPGDIVKSTDKPAEDGVEGSVPGDNEESIDKAAEDAVYDKASWPGDIEESTDKPAEDGVPIEGSLPGDIQETTDKPAQDGVTVEGSVPGDNEESIDKAAEEEVYDRASWPGDIEESTDKPAEDGVPIEGSLPGDIAESTEKPAEDGVTVEGSVTGDNEESIDKAAEDKVTDEGSLPGDIEESTDKPAEDEVEGSVPGYNEESIDKAAEEEVYDKASWPGDIEESTDKPAEDGVPIEGSLPGDIEESTDKPAEDGVTVEGSVPGDGESIDKAAEDKVTDEGSLPTDIEESTDKPAEDGVTVEGSVPGDEKSIDKAAEDEVTDNGSLPGDIEESTDKPAEDGVTVEGSLPGDVRESTDKPSEDGVTVAALQCYPNPCENGGVCIELSEGSYQCNCPAQYAGPKCASELQCICNPCGNRGTCMEKFSTKSYTCDCNPQYIGLNCDTESKCYAKPCQNGGDCVDLVDENSYRCDCPELFTGTNCESELKCYKNPCENAGVCKELLSESSYKCECPHPFTGENCETTIQCSRNPCLNGGTCKLVTDDTGYYCACPSPYVGKNCTTGDIGVHIVGYTRPLYGSECITLTCVLSGGIPQDVSFRWTLRPYEGYPKIVSRNQFFIKHGVVAEDVGQYECAASTAFSKAVDSIDILMDTDQAKAFGGEVLPDLAPVASQAQVSSGTIITSSSVAIGLLVLVIAILGSILYVLRKRNKENQNSRIELTHTQSKTS